MFKKTSLAILFTMTAALANPVWEWESPEKKWKPISSQYTEVLRADNFAVLRKFVPGAEIKQDDKVWTIKRPVAGMDYDANGDDKPGDNVNIGWDEFLSQLEPQYTVEAKFGRTLRMVFKNPGAEVRPGKAMTDLAIQFELE